MTFKYLAIDTGVSLRRVAMGYLRGSRKGWVQCTRQTGQVGTLPVIFRIYLGLFRYHDSIAESLVEF